KHEPRLGGLKGHDGVELPAFQQLSIACLPGNSVSGRNREAVPDVEVAAGVLRASILGILWGDRLEVQGTVVEAMTVRVTCGEFQPVRSPLGQRRLQAVVVGTVEVIYEVNDSQVGKFAGIRTV